MYEILRTLPQNARVLDLGSRSGSFGLDSCPSAVVIRLDTELSAVPGSGWFVQANAAYLPFRDGSFDTVIANHVLEHVEELRRYQELSVSTSGHETVVPIAVKLVSPELEFSHLLIGNFETGRIGIRIEFALHRQPGGRRGGGDEIDDDFMTDQRLAAPILANEGEQSVFNLVPLAGARWEVAN